MTYSQTFTCDRCGAAEAPKYPTGVRTPQKQLPQRPAGWRQFTVAGRSYDLCVKCLMDIEADIVNFRGSMSACDLLADAMCAIIDLDGCRGDCGDQTGACIPSNIRTYLGWETSHE